MARTPSNMVKLGTQAFNFTLNNPFLQKEESLYELKGNKGTLIVFMCNHCPFVIYVLDEIIALSHEYKQKGINVIGINANDMVNFPEDSPEKMVELIKEKSIPFTYLYDESQNIAKQYDAACTPDFYLYDENLKLVYRGQLDDSRPGNTKPTNGKDMRNAFENLLLNNPQDEFQKPSLGCNIKWK